jgi:hypothetical protein
MNICSHAHIGTFYTIVFLHSVYFGLHNSQWVSAVPMFLNVKKEDKSTNFAAGRIIEFELN